MKYKIVIEGQIIGIYNSQNEALDVAEKIANEALDDGKQITPVVSPFYKYEQ